MSGFIVLEDGRAWSVTNWAYDLVIEKIALSLSDNSKGQKLSEWLLEHTCQRQGPGLGAVDLRELTADNRKLFKNASRLAFTRAKLSGPSGWADPSIYLTWIKHFQQLQRLIKSVEYHGPSSDNPYMKSLIPPTGEKSGPGWDDDPNSV